MVGGRRCLAAAGTAAWLQLGTCSALVVYSNMKSVSVLQNYRYVQQTEKEVQYILRRCQEKIKMTVAEKIIQHVKELPEAVQVEVLDFVEHLESKAGLSEKMQEDADWSVFSLSQAMRNMEAESSPYSTGDLKEVFS